MNRTLEMPLEIPVEPKRFNVNMQAGPSSTFQFGEIREEQEWMGEMEDLWNQQSHRGKEGKELLKLTIESFFTLIGIPKEQWFSEWFHNFTNSGSDGMARCVRAFCDEIDTILVHTDNFSGVAGEEMKKFGRDFVEKKFKRGEALKEGSDQFQALVQAMREGTAETIFLTENATTTGANQQQAIEALVRERNSIEGCSTLIVVDMVSSPILGRQWNPELLPDAFFTAGQKDMGIAPGIGNLVFNRRALQRSKDLRERGLDTGGKLGVEDGVGTEEKPIASTGQTPQTPPLGLIFREWVILHHILEEHEVRADIRATQATIRDQIRKSVSEGDLGALGFQFLTKDPELQSLTMSVLKVSEKVSAKDIVKKLLEKGIAIAGGYGSGKDGKLGPDETEIRLGHYAAVPLLGAQHALDEIVQVTRELITASH